MAENFPNLGREMDIQIHKAQKIPNKLNLNRSTPRHVIIKLSKVKDKKILKVAREKREDSHKENSIRIFRPGRMPWHIKNIERKKPVSEVFYTWQSCPSEMRES